VRRQVLLLVCAVQFLTRLPTPRLAGFETDWISRAARYFPLVGQIVGATCAAVFLGAGQVWPPALAALLAVAAGVLVTGGFHEDGLADTADGLGGGSDAARRLEIMKDSRVGTYGVLALGLVLAVKVAALAQLSPWAGALALVAAHGGARAAAVVVMRLVPYVGHLEASKWKPAPANLSAGEVALALALGAWPMLLSAPTVALAGLGAGVLAAAVPALAARRLIGGYTGDVLGAVEQLFEAGFLLGAVAVLSA